MNTVNMGMNLNTEQESMEDMNMDNLREKEDDGNIHDLKKRILELEKQITEATKEKYDPIERNLKLEKEKNDEKSKKNKYEKEKDDILDFLEREVTCSVCLMIPRTEKIPICRNGHTTYKTCKR